MSNPFHGGRQNSYRIAVGSIFGIYIFFLWPLIQFGKQIFSLSEENFTITAAVFAASLLLICILPAVRKITTMPAVGFLVLFISSALTLHFFDKEVKTIVSEYGGYFKDNNPLARRSSSNHSLIPTFFSQTGGYTLIIPEHWVRKTLKDANAPYFQMLNDGKKLAELHPKCFHASPITLAEIVSINMKQNRAHSNFWQRCFELANGFNACLVKRKVKNTSKKRWTLLAVNEKLQQGIELDFVVFKHNKIVEKHILDIMASMQPTELPSPPPHCLSFAEWM